MRQINQDHIFSEDLYLVVGALIIVRKGEAQQIGAGSDGNDTEE